MDELPPLNQAGAGGALRNWLSEIGRREVLARTLISLVMFACTSFAVGTLAAVFRYGTLQGGAD